MNVRQLALLMSLTAMVVCGCGVPVVRTAPTEATPANDVLVALTEVSLPTFEDEDVCDSLLYEPVGGKWWRLKVDLQNDIPRDAPGIWEVHDPKTGRTRYYEDSGFPADTTREITVSLPSLPERIRVRFGLAHGPWANGFLGLSTDGAVGMVVGSDGELILAPISQNDAGCSFDLCHNVTNRQFRVIAITQDGSKVLPSGVSTDRPGALHRTRVEFSGLRADDIQEMTIQFRKYQWADLGHIARPAE